MSTAATILLVEDEPDLSAPLAYALGREGFAVVVAETGAAAVEAAHEHRPDLILLDLMLPDIPGTEVFRRVRGDAELALIPIIMVTARADEIDRIVGLELGADDYVIKPFNTRELILRIRAVMRRTQPSAAPEAVRVSDAVVPAEQVQFGALRFDRGAHQVWVGDDEVALTALEFRLLLALYERRGRVQSRDQLLADAWEDGVTVTERTVDTHVKRLRRKMGVASGYIQTIRGVGYRFRSRPDDA